MISNEKRRDAITTFLMEFEDSVMTRRQAESMAKYFVERNADPQVPALEKAVNQGRLEFKSQNEIIKRKNSEQTVLQNRLNAALAQLRSRRG